MIMHFHTHEYLRIIWFDFLGIERGILKETLLL